MNQKMTCPKCSRPLLEIQVWEVVDLMGAAFQQGTGECPFHGRINLARADPKMGWIEIKRKDRHGFEPPRE